MTTTPNKVNKTSNKYDNFLSLRSLSKERRRKYIQYAYHKLLLKYYSIPLIYEINIINNIIYNEKSHIVATFKDYLILDDNSEFLKRYYKLYESNSRLPRFYEYYNTYSKIYPNYTSILEGKYIYRNIQKKQRMIDIQEQIEIENKHNELLSPRDIKKVDDVFNTEVIDSILNDTNREDIEILFNVNRDNYKIEEEKFSEKVLDLVDTIDKFENINNNNNNINNNNENIFDYNTKTISKNVGNVNLNIMRKYLNNGLNKFTNLSKIFNKDKVNSNYKYILNIYSKKKTDKNSHNDSNNPNSERTLFEKLEHNILKLSKKNKTYIKKTSNSTTMKMKNKSKRDDSISSKHNISSYSRNTKNSTSINFNPKGSKSNNNIFNSLNPQTFRLGTNSIITSNENNIKSPVTRNIENRSKSNYRNKNININSNNYNNGSNHKKGNRTYQKVNSMNNIRVKTSRNTNKINNSNKSTNNIFIINHNQKYTTHIIVYNGDNSKKNSSKSHINNNYSNNNNNSHNNNNYINKQTINSQKNEKIIKKRNTSNIINSMTGTNNLLQTTRELNIKNYSLIRNSIKNKIKKNTTRNNSITKCNISTGKINNRNQSVGRNRKNDISKINDSSSNKMSKNDSLTKFNEINYRKKLIQGIQIKNFSKIFNINNHSKIEKKNKK